MVQLLAHPSQGLHGEIGHDYRAEMTVRFALWEQITGAVGRPTTA